MYLENNGISFDVEFAEVVSPDIFRKYRENKNFRRNIVNTDNY